MKTVEEFIMEIGTSEELKTELEAVSDRTGLTELLKKHGCGATAEELLKALKTLSEGEISDDTAEAAAGGTIPRRGIPDLRVLPI